jgi:hypothetical protein
LARDRRAGFGLDPVAEPVFDRLVELAFELDFELVLAREVLAERCRFGGASSPNGSLSPTVWPTSFAASATFPTTSPTVLPTFLMTDPGSATADSFLTTVAARTPVRLCAEKAIGVPLDGR